MKITDNGKGMEKKGQARNWNKKIWRQESAKSKES